jgi:glycosyltransferase involved in cell wall biosynthesis
MIDHSVIIPTYNHAEFLPETLNSVLPISKNSEIIVVNDGSTDNTATILAGFSGHRNIRLIEQVNKGAHAALNVGMSLAEGRYISILNDDDVFYENHLDYALEILDQNISNFVIHRTEVFGTGERFEKLKGHVTRGDLIIKEYGLLPSLFKFNWSVSTSAFSFSRNLYENGLRFSNLKMNHDLDFLLSAIFRFDARCSYSEIPTWKYRVHERGTGNMVNMKRQKWELSYTLLRTLMSGKEQMNYTAALNLIDYDLEIEYLNSVFELLADPSYLDNPDKFSDYLKTQFRI